MGKQIFQNFRKGFAWYLNFHELGTRLGLRGAKKTDEILFFKNLHYWDKFQNKTIYALINCTVKGDLGISITGMFCRSNFKI